MATSAYHQWDSAGRPWKISKPVKAIGDRLRAHGYVVYFLGADDETHLKSDLPEDHTPFSRTGWPKPNPYPWITALDVMPPRKGQKSKIDGKPLPSLQALGKRIHADKRDDHPGLRWLKYLNWEPDRDWGGRCWHDSWQPTHLRRTSTDRGHIHASGRTDHITADTSRGYDPVARIRAAATPTQPPKDDEMATTPEQVVDKLLTTRLGRGSRTVGMQLQDAAQAAALNKFAAESKLRDEALLAAVSGVDTATILARVDALAAELAERAEDEAARDAELRALVEQGLDGTDDPAEVIRRIGALLATAPDDR